MKTKILIGAAAAALVAGPAFAAPSDSDSFTVTATVDQECSLEDVDDVNVGTVPVNTDAGPNALLVNGSTPRSSDEVWLSCNAANQLTITSQNGGLVSASNAGAAAPFTNSINYRIAVFNYGGVPVLKTTGVPGESITSSTQPAIHAQVNVRVDVREDENPGVRPLAGTDYQDIATISVTAI